MALALPSRRISWGTAFVLLAIPHPAPAQISCASSGPDVIIGDIAAVANYAASGGLEAVALGPVTCNIGSAPANTIAVTPQHPVVASNLFRLKTVQGAGRFEQLGQGWLFHEISSLDQAICCTNCLPTDGNTLGVRCSSPDTAGIAGTQSNLGPKYQINPATGEFPFPPANPPYSGSVARRLQVKISDIDPALDGGGQYFVELQLVARDDSIAGNRHNNASYRPCTFNGTGQAWTLTLSGVSQRGQPALRAWHAADAAVVERDTPVPGDGLLLLAARATDLGNGQWHYEYALHNLNSDRAAQSFSVPIPDGVTVFNTGFHDVDYHDGDGGGNVNFDDTDWPASVASGAVTWATQTYAENPNANALRWGTLYNFRFDADAPPLPGGGAATIGLFKPGSPGSVACEGVTVPGPRCPLAPDGDIDASGAADGNDIGRLASSMLLPSTEPSDLCRADFNASAIIDEGDIPGFVAALLVQ